MMAFKAISPRMDYQARIIVEPSGKGSKVTLKGSAELKGLWRVMQPFMKSEFKAGVRKELTSLKACLETPN
jgi:hypothetical protein